MSDLVTVRWAMFAAWLEIRFKAIGRVSILEGLAGFLPIGAGRIRGASVAARASVWRRVLGQSSLGKGGAKFVANRRQNCRLAARIPKKYR